MKTFIAAGFIVVALVACGSGTVNAESSYDHLPSGVGAFCDGTTRVYFINADATHRGRAALSTVPVSKECQ